MDDDTLKKVIAAIRYQQVTQLHVMACLIELVEVVPAGEHRKAYVERIQGFLEGMNKHQEVVNELAGPDSDGYPDAS